MTTRPTDRTSTDADVLTDDMLARFDERAPTYDRENRFFDEDFAELKASGYLDVAIPTELGGGGVRPRRVLAARPPPRLPRPGDGAGRQHARLLDRRRRRPAARRRRLVPVRARAGGGRRRAVRPPRRGRQRPPAAAVERVRRARRRRLVDQRAQDLRQPHAGVDARRVPRHGHVRPGRPRRSSTASCPATLPASQIVETWDTLGMRATQSQDTVLDKAFVPDELVALVCPAGFAGAGMFQVSIFAWALLGFASIYLGAAKRAFDMTIERMPQRTLDRARPNSMAHHPEVQHDVSPRCAWPTTPPRRCSSARRRTGRAASTTPTGRCASSATRQVVINNAFDIVDRALDLSGGAGRVQAQPPRAAVP